MGMGNAEKSLTTGSPLHCARHANFFIQVVGARKNPRIPPKPAKTYSLKFLKVSIAIFLKDKFTNY